MKPGRPELRPDRIATTFSMWIRYRKEWYTPEEFYTRYGEGNNIDRLALEFVNPVHYLSRGRKTLLNRINSDLEKSTLLSQFQKLFAFEDKVRQFYKPHHTLYTEEQARQAIDTYRGRKAWSSF